MGNKLVNSLNTNVTQRGEINEQHQNVIKLIVQRDLAMLSATHQETPQTITQPHAVSVHHDDNHEHIQLFDEVVSAWQPWHSATPNYNLPRTYASTPITTFVGF
jgi:hypothetical protein